MNTLHLLADAPPQPSDIVRVSITFTQANGDEHTISGAVKRDAFLEITAPAPERLRLGKPPVFDLPPVDPTVSLCATFDPRPQWVVWGRSKAHVRGDKRTACGRSWGRSLPRIAQGEKRCKTCERVVGGKP